MVGGGVDFYVLLVLIFFGFLCGRFGAGVEMVNENYGSFWEEAFLLSYFFSIFN